MTMILKPVANESFCNTTQSTFGNSPLIRLFNSNTTAGVAGAFLLTRAVNSSVNIASVTLFPGQEMYFRKEPTELLSSNSAANNIYAVPIAFNSGS
jgi:hypothetical protein